MLNLLLLATLPLGALAQVTGAAVGFATGVTGGGNAAPAIPADNAELVKWLTDDTPRVIMLDKEYNFLETEGTKTETGCIPSSNTCGSKGQNALDGPNWCGDNPAVQVTYDVSPTKPIDIKGNKSIVGVGNKGVIRGKGFRLVNDVSNIIIQNVHFTELNPEYIWGGDALQLSGTDLVWIDHCKFSLVGRQMIVTGYKSAGRVTISNNDFDGTTKWSSSCNDQHYWTMLLIGSKDQITLMNNHIHNVSGRAPKIGSDDGFTMHAVNNYFSDSDGHNFDIVKADVLMEGNVFDNCKTPILGNQGSLFNVPDANAASQCSSYIGRSCELNSVVSSGDFPEFKDTSALGAFSGAKDMPVAMAVDKVAAYVVANAGIGKLSSAPSTPAAPEADEEDTESGEQDSGVAPSPIFTQIPISTPGGAVPTSTSAAAAAPTTTAKPTSTAAAAPSSSAIVDKPAEDGNNDDSYDEPASSTQPEAPVAQPTRRPGASCPARRPGSRHPGSRGHARDLVRSA